MFKIKMLVVTWLIPLFLIPSVSLKDSTSFSDFSVETEAEMLATTENIQLSPALHQTLEQKQNPVQDILPKQKGIIDPPGIQIPDIKGENSASKKDDTVRYSVNVFGKDCALILLPPPEINDTMCIQPPEINDQIAVKVDDVD